MLVLVLHLPAGEIELRLRDQIIQGELIVEDAERLVIRQRFMLRGEVHQIDREILRDAVLGRQDVPSPSERYIAQRDQTGADPVSQCRLAQWCQEQCLLEQATTHALAALAVDAEMVWARRILANCGKVEVDGRWLDEREHLASLGQARFGDRIVPLAQLKDFKDLRTAVGMREIAAGILKGSAAEVAMLEALLARRAGQRGVLELPPAMDEVRELQGRINALMGLCEGSDRFGTNNEKTQRIQAIVQRIQRQQAVLIRQMEGDLTKPTQVEMTKRLTARLERRKQEQTEALSDLAEARQRVVVSASRLPAEDPYVREALAGNAEPPIAGAVR
jgi:hypothetical protein